MGIDPRDYVNCIHTVLYGTQDIRILSSLEIFQDATNRGCTSVIVAHDRSKGEDLKPNEHEIDNATWLYHSLPVYRRNGRHMDVKVLDYLILNLDGFFSFNKDGLLKSIQKSMKYKTYTEVKNILDRRIKKIENKTRIETIEERNIELAKEMLLDNMYINTILKYTNLCLKDIEKIKKELDKIIDLAKKMLADNVDINKISKDTELTIEYIEDIRKDIEK